MDPFTLLHNDHEKVSELFQRIQSSKSSTERQDLFHELKNELLVHAEVEEEYFYPVLERKQEDLELEEHAIDEHTQVKQKLEEIENTTDDQKWMSLLKKLKEDIEHHVEEEEQEIFEEVRNILDENERQKLGDILEKEKKKRMKEMF
jgi:hemerythrin superfamily protein